ncbi:MAG: peptidoglycan-binding domain-containing protein [Hyphomicrobium sp.]
MTAGDFKIASVALVLLTVSVAINLLVLQERRPGSAIETSAIGPRSFEAKVAAALGVSTPETLGPPLAADATPLRLTPPKPVAVTSNAEIIRGIQRELNTRGYEAGPPDGVAGLVTRAAIMAYEHDYGLPLTATPSQDLLSSIVLGSSAPQAIRSATNAGPTSDAASVVRSVEQQLATLGYTPGKADGTLNEQSARAIREFEVDQKLPESGRISGPLVSRLIRLQGPATASAGSSKVKAVQR